MAHKIKAINAYRPRVEQGNTVQKPELIRALSRATSLVEGSVDHTMKELRDQLIEYCRSGRRPSGWARNLDAHHWPGWHSRNPVPPGFCFQLRAQHPRVFTGTILNRENLGKTSEELVAKWNTDNPDHLVSQG